MLESKPGPWRGRAGAVGAGGSRAWPGVGSLIGVPGTGLRCLAGQAVLPPGSLDACARGKPAHVTLL